MSPIQIVDKILLLLFLFHINHVIGQEKFDSIPITSISIPIKITGPINVTLPRESVELTIDFENDPNDSFENVSLSFQWEVIAGTGLATAKAYNRRKLTLVQLKSGVIVVRATVTGKDFNGRAEHTLELIEPPEASRPPQAVIRPEGPIESVEGNTLTLDAEGSLVSATPASFEWVQVSGPTVALSATNTPSLKIERLAQGVYKFRVTVSDTEGRSDSTTVTVNVKEERDDPPKAHITECGTGTATGMVSVRLPLNHIHLCANSSQDDKGIVEYRWYRVDSFTHELTVDIDGSSSNVLELRNLQATEQLGAYEFALDVVDGKHQKDSTKVSVFVHAAHNLPPEPNGGGNRTVILPESSLVLEGNAKDDGVIKAFNWTQISGPSTISIVNANQAKATISKLILGDYIFQFSVTDDGGLEAHDIVKVSVIRGENKPPIALAENVTVSLPISVVKLDGSASHDDAGIVAYRWTPDDDTPAILELLDGSQNTPVLLVGGLVEGIFKFNFSVRDQQEEKDEKWVWLHVEKGEAERESVELLIRQSVERFSYLQKSKLENRIAAILSSGVSGVSQVLIHTTRLEEYHSSGGDFRMLFWAEAIDQTAKSTTRTYTTISSSTIITNPINLSTSQTEEMRRKAKRATASTTLKADTIVAVLRGETTMHEIFSITSIEPKYCHLECSGHGRCSDKTKECVCDRFWMPSLIGILFSGGKHYDCGWSSIYFSIGFTLFSLFVVYYLFIKKSRTSWTKKAKRLRFRRRRRYSPVHSEDSDEEQTQKKLQKNKPFGSTGRLQPLPLPPSSDSLLSDAEDLLLPKTMPRKQKRHQNLSTPLV